MRRALGLSFGFALVALFGAGCEEIKEACGPCGTIEAGDGTISGDASLDGFFKALGSLNANVGKINARFEAQVRDLAAAFEVEGAADMELDALVEATVEAIRAELDGSIEGGIDGGLKVVFVPPKCEVSVEASVTAQAQCEAKAGCDVDVGCEGGEMSFKCEGECHGSCDGECEIPMCTVALEADLACGGTCSGGCVASVSGACEGECRGTCGGECSAYDGAGNCKGACEGTCDGECRVEVEGECEGRCEGECQVKAEGDITCTEPSCHGNCEGECSGGCEGEIKEPKCSLNASCDATAKCNAQAEASASANAGCAPPSLELDYSLSASLEADASVKAAFLGKMKAFRENMIGMLQGMANLRILFDAEAAAEIGIEPPTVTLAASFQSLLEAGVEGDFEIKPALLGCTVDALEESVTILTDLPGRISGTVEGQARFYAVLFE